MNNVVTLRNTNFQAFELKHTLQRCSLIFTDAVQNDILKSSSFKMEFSLSQFTIIMGMES